MANFQITDQETGKTYWISPAVAVCGIITDGEGNLLVHRRGKGCPNNVGKLSTTCGYHEFGSPSVIDSLHRELYEEVNITKDNIVLTEFTGYNDQNDELENVTFRFWVLIDKDSYQYEEGDRGGEANEVEDVHWMSLEEIEATNSKDWAFGHRELIIQHYKAYKDRAYIMDNLLGLVYKNLKLTKNLIPDESN